MAETKDLNPRSWEPSDPNRDRRKINAVNKKGADNPMGEEPYGEEDPLEVMLADFDAVGMDWQENFRRQIRQARTAAGEPDGG